MILLDNAKLLLDCLASIGNLIEVVDKRGYYVYCSENCNYDKMIRQQAIDEFSDTFNRVFLRQALDAFHGNISKTAQAINISRQHLYELINKYDVLQS